MRKVGREIDGTFEIRFVVITRDDGKLERRCVGGRKSGIALILRKDGKAENRGLGATCVSAGAVWAKMSL